nr:glutaminase [Microcystis sp. M113S1]
MVRNRRPFYGGEDVNSLVNSGQKLVYPFRNYLNYLQDKYSDLQTGKIADYIPELALAAPQWFGISVITTDVDAPRSLLRRS